MVWIPSSNSWGNLKDIHLVIFLEVDHFFFNFLGGPLTPGGGGGWVGCSCRKNWLFGGHYVQWFLQIWFNNLTDNFLVSVSASCFPCFSVCFFSSFLANIKDFMKPCFWFCVLIIPKEVFKQALEFHLIAKSNKLCSSYKVLLNLYMLP